MNRGSLLVAVLAVACVKIPEFKGGDGGTDTATSIDAATDASINGLPGVRAVSNGTSVFVELPGLYEMQFSEQAYRYPYSWGIGATPSTLTYVMYNDANNMSCVLERDMGIAFYPAHVVTSVPTSGTTSESASLDIDLMGPGIAKVRTTWNATLACGTQINGTTTYSFFPDGRISRMDFAKMPLASMGNNCDCAGDADWRVYGYTTFKRDVTNGVQNVGYPATTDMVGASVTGTQCIESNSQPAKFRIGYGWKNTQGTQSMRVRAPDSMSFALAGDLLPPAQSIGGGASNGHLGDTTTTMYASLTDSCNMVKAKVLPFTQDPQLELVTSQVTDPMGMSQDGIFGGETAFSDGNAGHAVLASPVTVRPKTGNIPPFGLWLEFGVIAQQTPPVVSRTPAKPAPWYSVQRPTPSQYLFWFPDGLNMGETIVIGTQ